jgi:hypothetical protein
MQVGRILFLRLHLPHIQIVKRSGFLPSILLQRKRQQFRKKSKI